MPKLFTKLNSKPPPNTPMTLADARQGIDKIIARAKDPSPSVQPDPCVVLPPRLWRKFYQNAEREVFARWQRNKKKEEETDEQSNRP
jgi:hypothetical protein